MTIHETGAPVAPYVPEHLEPWSEDGPTAFDSAANYAGADLTGFYLAPVSINRDTQDAITLSNWRVVTADLEKLTQHDESGIHRFGHWGCGWYELFLIHATDEAALRAADQWAASLADYCVADEADLSEVEHEAEGEEWESWALSEWRDHVAKALSELAPPDADCYWADEAMDAISDEALTDLWHELAGSLNWSVEHGNDGCHFNFEGAAKALSAGILSDLTGATLLPADQQWRREPYPWEGAEPAPLVREAQP